MCPKLPSSLPRGARNGSPNLRPAWGGLVGVRGAQTLRFPGFYARPGMPLESGPPFSEKGHFQSRGVFFVFLLQHLSNGSAHFGQEAVPIRVPAMVFQPDAFQLRGVAKIGPMRFSRALQ